MKNKEFGFILKRFFPFKNKISILHEARGKISLITNPTNIIQKLWPGMLIEFHIVQGDSKITIASNIEIICSHTHLSHENLQWMHSILELCYYSLPHECPAKDAFDFLNNCAFILKKTDALGKKFEKIKKFLLLKLLILLGFYPSESLLSSFRQYSLICSIFVDISDKQKVEFLEKELANAIKLSSEEMDKWILSSLKKHPLYRSFKTSCFTS